MQLLNYGGEDLSQENLKIGTHVFFVGIMDGDVLSNTHTQVGGLGWDLFGIDRGGGRST